MLARLSAKAIFWAVVIALIFFGVGLLGFALALALTPQFGAPGAYAIAGAAFLVPPLLVALGVALYRPTPKAAAQPAAGRELMNSLFMALARETPWVAVAGAGLLGVTNLLLNRYRQKK